ncbi:MAG: patatin-like protein [Rhodospirillaceae bacterium]|nr:patatin-like protein [Rhodospirillaceae bacterium]
MKELRIGLVLYGGVSLAVYMNGVVTEIWNALRASVARDPDAIPAGGTAGVYRKLMEDLKRREECDDLRIVVDTIAGTSAGGVNGVVLGKAIASGADASVLNKTWIEKAGIEELAAPPPGRAPWWLRFGDNALALLNSDFRKLRRRFDETNGINWAWARDHLYSFLTSDKPEKTPLRGDYFTRMIASTLEEMTDGYGGPKLIPPGGRLDLVLTRTDLYGWPRHLPVHAPLHDALLETAHAHQMRFQFRRTLDPARQGGDHDFKDDFGLTYAARTTAGFPVAFAPVGYRTAVKSFSQVRHSETFAGQDNFAARHLPEHHLAAYKSATAWMVDGGILDNKPFSAAIRLIEEKPADRSVYRTLMYIEPDPSLANSAGPALMPLPREMPSLLYKLFRHEPVFADLHTVAARNRLVERLLKIADAAEAHGESIMRAALAKTPRNLEQLRVAANDHLRTGNNPSYPGYTVLKARRAADTLAGSISEALGYPHESKHGYFVRQVIRAYFRRQNAFVSPDLDIRTETHNSNASQIALLKAFDVSYRLRRLRYLVRVANCQYGNAAIGADTVDSLKGALMRIALAFDELTEWVRGEGEEIRKRLQQDLGADLDTYIRGYAGDLSEFRSADFPGIDGLCEWLRTQFIQTMNDQGELVRHAISKLQGSLHDRIAKAYVVYPMIDSAIFPVMDSAGVRDLSTTRVIRISPHDAKALSKDPYRLKSRELGAFAGFLRKDAREHDLLWGRLDGAERLIDLIIAAAFGDTPTLPNEILKMRSAALNAAIHAILDDESERGGSAAVQRVIEDLRIKLPV